jgi:NAD(P) transhydrogenase subunit beta
VQGKGYSGVANGLSYEPNCNMVYGDAQAMLTKMIEAVRELGATAAD